MTEAETLRQCVARKAGYSGPTRPVGLEPFCGEPIAWVGETWEHVDPKHPCDHCIAKFLLWNEAEPCVHQVVPRGHQAIPGEVRVTPSDPADADHAAALERVLQTYVDHVTDETP